MKIKIGGACLPILFLALSLVITGCASPGPLAVQQASYPADKVDAHGLFVENCATCHGKNGRAHTFHGWLVGAQNLTDAKFQANTSDEEIIKAIKTGPSVMPAFEKKLSSSEIDALATYVRSFRQAERTNRIGSGGIPKRTKLVKTTVLTPALSSEERENHSPSP